MSEFRDELFRRLQRINAGLEPDTQPGRRCARCQKDMSDYLLLLEPESTNVCNECEVEIRKEGYVARWKAAKAPVYDIDEILSTPGRKEWDVVSELNSKIDPFCPESLLFEAELIVRDFEDFSCLTGHDFGYILGLGDGARIFLHALWAMRAIGATHMTECMTKIRDFAVTRGVAFPDPLPDPWLNDITIDSDMENELHRLTEELKPYDGLKGGDLDKMVVEYLRLHVEVLRQRKAKNECT
jgi:hypothetical protein